MSAADADTNEPREAHGVRFTDSDVIAYRNKRIPQAAGVAAKWEDLGEKQRIVWREDYVRNQLHGARP
jgi:hypothetical protein